MKAVLMSIQPYYVFLIIARLMGWDIPKEKTIEVRKDFPKDKDWNKVVKIYCSKNRKSFRRIPAQYQPFMEKLLGKVIGEFVCDDIDKIMVWGNHLYCVKNTQADKLSQMCLTIDEVIKYLGEKDRGFNWHISDLKIYDKPKELGDFWKAGKCQYNSSEGCTYENHCYRAGELNRCGEQISHPPQSWCYIEQ